jgi:microcystin-dependent protein
VPQSFLDAMQEFISTLTSNFALTIPQGSMNQVQVVAGTDNTQVGIGINGLWRYITATITTVVSGAAGTYDLYVTTGNNSFPVNPTPPPPELDQTSYGFALTAVATGTQPTGVAHFRMVGQALTDGTRIIALRQLVGGAVDGQQLLQPGMIQTTAAMTVPPGWLLCNGIAVPRNTFSALYAALGGPNSPWGQGDGSTTFNVPDLRGKVQVGAGAGPGLTNRALAAQAGVEAVALNDLQSGVNRYGSTGYVSNDHSHAVPGQWTGGENQGHVHTFYGGQLTIPVAGSWSYSSGNPAGPWTGVYVASGGYTYVGSTDGPNVDHQHYVNQVQSGGISANHNHAFNARNADQSHENMPPFAAVNVIIKT